MKYNLNKARKQNRAFSKRKSKRVGEKMVNKIGIKRYLRYVFLIVLVLLFLIWVGNIYIYISTLEFTDVVQESSEVFEVSEPDEVRKTLLIYEDVSAEDTTNLFILLVIYNTDISELLIYYFPQDLYIQDDFGEIYVSIGNLTYAGNTFMYGSEHAYVLDQISTQTALDFDSYVWIKPDLAKLFFSSETGWGREKDEVLSIFSGFTLPRLVNTYYQADIVSASLYSNLSFMDIYRYFNKIDSVISSDRHEFIDLGQEDFTRKEQLDARGEVDVLNLEKFDNSIQQNYGVISSRDLAREQVKVEVYNATEVPLYARKMARRINNLGCNIVRYENTSYEYEKDYIYIPNREEYSVALGKVKQVIEDPVIKEKRPDFLTTADIVVVLGEE